MANKRIIHYTIVWNWWMAYWADRSAEGYRQDSISAYDYGRQLMYENLERSAREKAQKRQRVADVLTLLLLAQKPNTTRAAATPRAVLVVDVASLPAGNALADEFAEIEQFMAISDKFHLTEVGGKMTLLPREPLVINIDDDGYGWTSGGLG